MKSLPIQRFLLSSFFLTLLFLFIPITHAFADTYILSGTITDSSGAPVENADITITNDSTGVNAGNATSNSSGEYSASVMDGVYNIQVNPPGGSSFSSAIALHRNVFGNTTLNFILTPTGTVKLSGRIYGPLGNPLPNQTVYLQTQNGTTTTTTTDSSGNYSLEVASGTYTLDIYSNGNSSSLNIPQNYELTVTNYSLTQTTLLDITLPAKQVTTHVQDASGNPVSNVSVTTPNTGANVGIVLASNVTAAAMSSDARTTNATGDTSLWLFPTSSGRSYTFTATPQSGSVFSTTILPNVSFSEDTNSTITMQEPVTLSGHIYGPLGNPLPNQTIILGLPNGNNKSVNTDENGEYSLEFAPAIYDLDIYQNGNSSSLNAPQNYEFLKSNYQITEDTTLNITLPAKEVTVHVKDAAGNALNNIQVTTSTDFGNASLDLGDITVQAKSTAAITSNASGEAKFWLFPNSSGRSYAFTAVPPSGSEYSTTILSNQVVMDDEDINLIMKQPVTLSGHIYGPLGNPIPNQTVTLYNDNINQNVQTDSEGHYSLQVPSAVYTLDIYQNGNSSSLNVPQDYELTRTNYALNQDTTLDITIPAKRVDVKVQDALNNPISNVDITTSNEFSSQTLPIAEGIQASGMSRYGEATTTASGEATLWLFPNDTSHKYTLFATPSIGSIYSSFTLSNLTITSNQNELISLQYAHNPPVTTASLSPSPNGAGDYSNPVTASLFATPTEGYTIANTYYKIDNGSQQTYTAPFNINGSGGHTITYWSVDNSGVTEAHKNKNFVIVPDPTPTATATPTPTSTPPPTAIPTPTPTYTVGFTTQGTTLSQGSHDYMNGSKYTTGATGGNVASMSVYVGNIGNSTHRNYQLSIYTNKTNGKPGTKVASTATGTLTANSWNTLPITATLSANTTYWLMYNNNGQNDSVNNIYYSSGTSNMGAFAERTFGSWPTTFPPPDMGNWKYSIYVTYH